ncbi:hypothetical protein AB1Y20_000994 [Prymnesium parvum]|uniref:Saposin B-type domain-containing protein n=1 Tax=Prymnesium parvum TaxID=97485 RepID=A0AB34KA52_PRYPA
MLLAMVISLGQLDLGDMPPGALDSLPKRAQPAPLDSDIPFLRCAVCQELALTLYGNVKRILNEQVPTKAPKRRLETSSNLGGVEADVETMLSDICNPETFTGNWTRQFDVVKSANKLELKPMPIGKCRRECRTIEKVCNGILDSLADDDLGEFVLNAAKTIGASAFPQRMCSKLATVCKKGKTPVWPDGKVRKNEVFIALTESEIDDEHASLRAQKMKTTRGNYIKSYKVSDMDIEGIPAPKVDPRDELRDEL